MRTPVLTSPARRPSSSWGLASRLTYNRQWISERERERERERQKQTAARIVTRGDAEWPCRMESTTTAAMSSCLLLTIFSWCLASRKVEGILRPAEWSAWYYLPHLFMKDWPRALSILQRFRAIKSFFFFKEGFCVTVMRTQIYGAIKKTNKNKQVATRFPHWNLSPPGDDDDGDDDEI